MEDTALKVISIVLPLLVAVVGWLWRQINNNTKTTNTNATDIALAEQRLQSAEMNVIRIDDSVKKLSEDLTQVKFALKDLSHKQDKNHSEIMGILKSKKE